MFEMGLVKVRQEIETKYGHYNEVRRRAIGILQAVDVNLIKKETIRNASEEQLLAAPQYWLSSCLVALSAWLNNEKELAERAMMEALRKDDEKASLFFALVTRRGARYKASQEWLDRYLSLQDPHQLERGLVILIDGFTNGIFGLEGRNKCKLKIEEWIQELSQHAGLIESQHEQWKAGLTSKIEKLNPESYPYLRNYSSTWANLETSLEEAKLHDFVYQYFFDIINKEVVPARNIAFAVDALLDTLVSQFDDEELLLWQEERLLSLIVEIGDYEHAQTIFENEWSLVERLPFIQLLTDFALYPELFNASLATQKLSIAYASEWICHAYDDLTAENRAKVPIEIEITVGEWTGTTRDGRNEQQLVNELDNHIDRIKRQVLNSNYLIELIACVAFSLVLVFGSIVLEWINNPIMWIIPGIPIVFTIYYYLVRKNISNSYDNQKLHSQDILRATLSDVVDYRREYAIEDVKSVKINELLKEISPENYTFTNHDTSRTVISS